MTIDLSTDQTHALDRLVDWYKNLNTEIIHCNGGRRPGIGECPRTPHTHAAGHAPISSLGGLAGTGKTTLMRTLEQELGVQAIFGTPTHKAAAVLRKKLAGTDQAGRVRTYHSIIYHMHAVYRCGFSGLRVQRIVDTCTCGQDDACQCPARFDPCTGKPAHTCHVVEELKPERREFLGGHREIVIIDESSMLSEEQVNDVRSFGVPVLLVGDHGQLPPVKAEMNPWTQNPEVLLTEIHRQGKESGVLAAAHDARRNGRLTENRYGKGDAVRYPYSHPLMEGVFDRWEPGPDALMVTHTNRLRAEINAARHGGGPPHPGDRVVALGGRTYDTVRVTIEGSSYRATSDFLTVHNGMTGTVRHIHDRGGPTLDMVVELDDHVLATPDSPVCLLVGACARAQFGAETDLPFNSPDRPRNSRLWDYAYALTAHKAQGSEFSKVIVMDEGTTGSMYAQWLYTSITRAKDAVIITDYRR